MKAAIPLGGCGCAAGVALLVLVVPLLFFGAGAGASGDAAGSGAGVETVAAGGASCSPAVHCQQLPAEFGYVPVDFFPDAYTNPPGECTSWAAALWPGHHGHGVTWSGDAWEWYANAAAQGYVVSASPTVGAIAVFAQTTGAGEWGHVAIVIGRTASSIRVTEMNEVARFVVDQRTVGLPDPLLVGFVPLPSDAFS